MTRFVRRREVVLKGWRSSKRDHEGRRRGHHNFAGGEEGGVGLDKSLA